MAISKQQVLDALKGVKHPETRLNIIESGMVENLDIQGKKISFMLNFNKPKDPFAASLKKTAEAALRKLGENLEIEITIFSPPQVNIKLDDPMRGVKNKIAVTSGKGGVGKSTIAVNLAVAMAKTGAKVGLVDADVYGPSLPKMFQLEDERPMMKKEGDKDIIIPIEKFGVKVVSIGFFVKPEDALVWRGPMATSALKQLMSQTDWGELDYLFIDMPPGTGDIHLTLVQETDITGAVIVSTPQEVALADAIKGIAMFTGEKINVPVLGLIENMAWFTPAELPENKYFIFGKEGVKKLAEKMNVSFLGQIPIVQSICEDGDTGKPSVLNDENPVSKAFEKLAKNVESAVKERNLRIAPTKKVEITNS